MLKGEISASGTPYKCKDCGVVLRLKVLRSNAGYYIGTQCDCGPYSRESQYYKDVESANKDLVN
jgi:hypothetical protein